MYHFKWYIFTKFIKGFYLQENPNQLQIVEVPTSETAVINRFIIDYFLNFN
jgi:hypothetical protein